MGNKKNILIVFYLPISIIIELTLLVSFESIFGTCSVEILIFFTLTSCANLRVKICATSTAALILLPRAFNVTTSEPSCKTVIQAKT